MTLIDVRVAEIIDESANVKSLRLIRVDGEPLGVYQAGAHVDVIGPSAITRQYSLCSKPEDPDSYVVAVKREADSRGGSTALHELQVGDVIQISQPRNLLQLAKGAHHHVLMAAGIGITPMLSIARYLDLHGRDFDLHYFARSTEEAAFLGLLQEKCPQKLHAHLGVPRAGHPELIRTALTQVPEGAHLYMCGPEGFMDTVMQEGLDVLPEERIHKESFHPAEQQSTAEDSAFDVELEGETFHIPADRTIVEVLREADIDVDTSCQEGICGTCIMQVLEGDLDHRDSVLTKSEKESGELITVCVSRCTSPVLRLDYY